MSAAAMANWAAGSSGVGPGVYKRVLRIMVFSSFLAVALRGYWNRSWTGSSQHRSGSVSPRPSVNHRIHIFVVFVVIYFCGNLPARHFGPPISILPEGEDENSPGRGPRHTVFVC